MTPHEHMRAIATLTEQINAHPMCLRFTDTDGVYLVIYPAGMNIDGCRASYKTGERTRTEALERILNRMERDWIASGVQ